MTAPVPAAEIERQIAAASEAHDKQYRDWFNAQPGLDPQNKLHPRVDVQPYLERIAALEAALAPFAARAAFLEPDWLDDECHWHPAVGSPVTIAHLRQAALVLETTHGR